MRRSDCERVTEREELVGRLSLASRFPQYLEAFVSLRMPLRGRKCMGEGPGSLYNGDVYRCRSAGPIDFVVFSHGFEILIGLL